MRGERYEAFGSDPVTVGRRLLGQRLVHVFDGTRMAGDIVEVEAYLGPPDEAAHTRGGRHTRRNASMWLGGGYAYVYFIYGMHHCLNVVCGQPGDGTAVLIRALEPVEGVEAMFANRPPARRTRDLCSGPGKLTQALTIGPACDGADLRRDPDLYIERRRRRTIPSRMIDITPRIGVGYAGTWAKRRLRFLIKGNAHVSRVTTAESRSFRKVFG